MTASSDHPLTLMCIFHNFSSFASIISYIYTLYFNANSPKNKEEIHFFYAFPHIPIFHLPNAASVYKGKHASNRRYLYKINKINHFCFPDSAFQHETGKSVSVGPAVLSPMLWAFHSSAKEKILRRSKASHPEARGYP